MVCWLYIGLSCGVWFGNDDDSPMQEITGGTAPALLWRDFYEKAHKGIPEKSLNYVKRDLRKNKRNSDKIDRILKKAKQAETQKSVFEKILDNFFKYFCSLPFKSSGRKKVTNFIIFIKQKIREL